MSILVLPNPLRSDNGGIPSGLIAIWSGTEDNIPSGWHICDGTEGTPDLRDRFVLGAGETHPAGEKGGEEEVTLTVDQMPQHGHAFQYVDSATSFSGIGNGGPALGRGGKFVWHGANETTIIGHRGSSQPHPNMPPYYTLAYIMKL